MCYYYIDKTKCMFVYDVQNITVDTNLAKALLKNFMLPV